MFDIGCGGSRIDFTFAKRKININAELRNAVGDASYVLFNWDVCCSSVVNDCRLIKSNVNYKAEKKCILSFR